jgi:hypothetical protein
MINSAKGHSNLSIPSLNGQAKVLKRNKSMKRSLAPGGGISKKSTTNLGSTNLVDSSVEFVKLLESQVTATQQRVMLNSSSNNPLMIYNDLSADQQAAI